MMDFKRFASESREDVLRRIATAQSDGAQGDPMEDAQHAGPTVRELLALSDQIPQVRYMGYQVYLPRRDVRVSIDGFTCAGLTADQVLNVLKQMDNADEEDWEQQPDGTYTMRLWWD